MKTLSVVLFLLLAASFASAGEIFGTITEADKPIAAGVKIEITVAGNTYTGDTDKFGSYRIFAKDKGKGTLKVFYNKQTPGADIFSFDKATRYDWIVENTGGKLSLTRK